MKGLVIGIIILMIGVNIGSSFARDTQPIGSVGFDGNILYVGGSGPNNYTSIHDAIEDAVDGDTIFVYGGIYYECVDITKMIYLIGENRFTTIIDGGGSTPVHLLGDVSGASVENFTIRNGGNGISFRVASYNRISNNIITNNELAGLFIEEYTYNNYILDNTITNNGADGIGSIGFFNNYRQNISGNIITYNDNGIYLAGSSDNYIVDNIIENNRYMGIWLIDSENNIISRNSIKDNMLWAISLEYSPNNTISFNNFINNYYPPRFENCHTNEWIENYWDNWIGHKFRIFRFFPKFIFGFDERGLPWINFDWHPVKVPYEIP